MQNLTFGGQVLQPDPLLDNPVWSALTTHQAPLALGGASARRFPAEYSPFAATVDASAASLDALADLYVPGDEPAMATSYGIPLTPRWEIFVNRDMLQMIAADLPAASPRTDLIELGAPDNAAMQALAEETRPGPFSTRTRELGRFLGVKVDGRLVAMTGERMHFTGYTEVTAVCVLPDFRGRGYARDLVVAVAQGIAARGETPILHVFADNPNAVALYRSLGFALRTTLRLTRLRRLP